MTANATAATTLPHAMLDRDAEPVNPMADVDGAEVAVPFAATTELNVVAAGKAVVAPAA